ncbi:MAG: succinate--CoA ligase subunit alpha [Anaerolineaceae bacterium]|nr:succinate--CoA ligase subunit alpha [Anaerolineaceae bacterium]
MSVYINRNTRLLVQGITGTEGLIQSKRMLDYHTNIVAGVSPGKGGEWVLEGKVPVFDSTRIAVELTGANAALVIVPARYAKDVLLECGAAQLPLVICITEGIPWHDLMIVKRYYDLHNIRLIGPGTPGIFAPQQSMAGIFPFNQIRSGNVGIISRSGSLTYEVLDRLEKAEIGVSSCVCIGSSPMHGTGFIHVLDEMQRDPQTEKILLVGRIGGTEEEEAAEHVNRQIVKPVIAYVAGEFAPLDKITDRSGTVSENGIGSFHSKVDAFKAFDIPLAKSIAQIPELLR